jgi:hypothetical protein
MRIRPAKKTQVMTRNSTILTILVAGVIVVLVVIVAIPVPNSPRTSSQSETVTQSGIQFQIQELNQTNTMKAGTTATFLFNVTSPATGTMYFGVYVPPPPPTRENLTIANMTSRNLRLPHGVNATYPNGNIIAGTSHGTALFQLTLAPTVPAGNLTLSFTVPQQVSSSVVSGEGRGFTVTIQT